MVPSHWIALVGSWQLLGGLLVVIGRTRAIGPGFAWTYSRQHFSLPYFYTRRSRNCTRFGIFRIGDLSYLRLPYLLSGHFYRPTLCRHKPNVVPANLNVACQLCNLSKLQK